MMDELTLPAKCLEVPSVRVLVFSNVAEPLPLQHVLEHPLQQIAKPLHIVADEQVPKCEPFKKKKLKKFLT